MSDEYYMNIAFKLAKKAYKKGDVPVGAVIVKDGKIIGKGYNRKQRDNCAIYHAEILAIMSANSKQKSWYLNDCTLYVTLEPCLMCCGAMLQSRIRRLVYGASCDKFGFAGSIDNVLNNSKNNHFICITSGIMGDKCSSLLKNFFCDKRN